MRQLNKLLIAGIFVLPAWLLGAASIAGAVPAYPDHPGGHYSQDRHAFACGGSPTICKVTNLNGHSDSSGSCSGSNPEVCSGSIRYCVNALDRSNGKVVVFENSGLVDYDGELKVKNDCTAIFGQTAPAPGVFLKSAMINLETGGTHQVHFLASHFGIGSGDEADMGVAGNNRKPFKARQGEFNLDHMTLLWGVDSTSDMSAHSGEGNYHRCLMAEALHDSIHVDQGQSNPAPHSTGFILGDGTSVTWYKNVIAQIMTRGPLIRAAKFECINNIFYNWDEGRDSTVIDNDHGAVDADFRSNYWLCGPNTGDCATNTAIQIENGDTLPSGSDVCMAGNLHQNADSTEGTCVDAGDDGTPDCADQFDIIENTTSGTACPGPAAATGDGAISSIETNMETLYADLITAGNVGYRPADADKAQWAADFAPQIRILGDIADDCATCPTGSEGPGIKDCVGGTVTCTANAGGWPVITQNQETWNHPTDPFGDSDGDGWTNIEECIHHGTGCSGNASYTDLVEPDTAPGGGTGGTGGTGESGGDGLFNVERGSTTFGASSRSSSQIDLTQSLGDDDGFCVVTNTMWASGNPKATTSDDQSTRDMGVRIEYVDNDTIQFHKDSGADLEDSIVEYECVTYVGAAAGDYEWDIVFRGDVTLTAATSANQNITVTDLDKTICVVGGVVNDNSGSNQDDRRQVTCQTGTGPDKITVTRGDGTNNTVASVVAIEFLGSGWDEIRNDIALSCGDGANTANAFTAVTDIAHCMLFYGFNSNDNENADLSPAVWFKDVDEIYCRMDAASTPSTFSGIAHVACATNDNTGLTVEHLDSITGSGTDHSSTGTTKSSTLATPVDQVDQTIVRCSGTNDLASVDYPAGWYNYELSGASTIDWFTPRAGATVEWACSVAQMPTETAASSATLATTGRGTIY